MPRGHRAGSGQGLEGLDQLVQEIGKRLGESLGAALVAGITSGVQRAGGIRSALGSAGPAAGAVAAVGGHACRVPGCIRRAVAKGLCATHYRKARRLKMGDEFDQKALSELAEDGRKTRFAKSAD